MNRHKKSWNPAGLLAAFCAAGVLVLAGCSMDVDNPTDIEDADLYTEKAIPALVAGAAADFAEATAQDGGGGVYMAGALLTDELVHVGTWYGLRGFSEGFSDDDWPIVQSLWGETSQARWTAEEGIVRVSQILEESGKNPSSSPAIAKLALWAGHSNRVLGDSFCKAVINGKGYQPHTIYYERALNYFTQAVNVAAAAELEDIRLSAIGGRALVYMMQGRWNDALTAAAKIPTTFVFYQQHADNGSEENEFRWWAYERNETSVWGTPFAEWGQRYSAETGAAVGGGDPRVAFDIALTDEGDPMKGGDSRRPYYRQLKYTSYGDDIPVVKGTGMRLLEAEAALVQSGNTSMMVSKINEVRQYHGLAPIDPATVTNPQEAWTLLQKEHGLEFWLEGKRLPAFRRWAIEPGYVTTEVVRATVLGEPPSADPRMPSLETAVMERTGDMCIKVSSNEKESNLNI